MKAVETKDWILKLIIKEFCVFMLLSEDLTFCNSWSLSSESTLYLSSILSSSKHAISFYLLLELIKFNSFDLIMTELFLEESLHAGTTYIRTRGNKTNPKNTQKLPNTPFYEKRYPSLLLSSNKTNAKPLNQPLSLNFYSNFDYSFLAIHTLNLNLNL